MRAVIGPDEKKRLMRNIFGHLYHLPEKEIKEPVILVSYSDDQIQQAKKADHACAIFKITGKSRTDSDKYPLLFTLEDGIKLIDSTNSFLRPEKQVNFVTMHYLMNMVDRAKFVFVFNASQMSQLPYDNIKKLFVLFTSFFKNINPSKLSKLVESCGLLILDTDKEIGAYQRKLVGGNFDQNLLEEGYIPKQQYRHVKVLVKGILENKRVLLCPTKQGEKLITSEFLSLVKKLNYFQLQGSFELTLQSTYQQYVSCEIYKLWEEVFSAIYNNLDALILAEPPEKPTYGDKSQENQIYKLIKDYNFDRYKGQKADQAEKSKKQFKSIRLMRVLNSMIKLILKFIENKIQIPFTLSADEEVVTEFMDTIFSSGFIKNSFIKIFIMSYFSIRKFLSKTGEQMNSIEKDLFHRVNFCDIIRSVDVFHPKMRQILIALLRELETDLTSMNKYYPANDSLNLLNSLISFKEIQQFSFFTDRVSKKLLKYRANIAYSLIGLNKQNKKDLLKCKINFLRWSLDSKLTKDKLKIQVLIDISLTLAEHPNLVKKALQILLMLPQYQTYKHVKYIYENQLKLNVEVLQYLPENERKNLLDEHFQGYYTFFLKLGFQQTVREMSMECLRLSDNQQDRQFYKKAFVMVRGNEFRNLHNSFLESSILQEKQVNFTVDLIDQIETLLNFKKLI